MSYGVKPVMSLPFEVPILELDLKIAEFEDLARANDMDFSEEVITLRQRREEVIRETFSKLSAWDRVQVARHAKRPQTVDYVEMICEQFVELAGDRLFGDDHALLTGLTRIGGERVMLVGQCKGRDTTESIRSNWGMLHPEGYRKALAKMRLAEKFGLPIVTLIDTKGAYPGVRAEERGQSQAIAENLREMSLLRTPIICVVIGEGGSGGALGIGVGDRLCILEYSYYSVISPEGCAAILWRDAKKAPEAAEALKLTGRELLDLDVVDAIIPEPPGGAHRNPQAMAKILKEHLLALLRELKTEAKDIDALIEKRYRRLRRIGKYHERARDAIDGA